MARSVQDIQRDVRSLHVSERNQLLRELIADIDDGEPGNGIEELWLREAQRRYEELRNGTVAPVPADEVIRRAKSRLKNES